MSDPNDEFKLWPNSLMMTRCPYCEELIRHSRLEKHLKKTHPSEPPLKTTPQKRVTPSTTPPKNTGTRGGYSMEGINPPITYEVDEFGTVQVVHKRPQTPSFNPSPKPASETKKYPLDEATPPSKTRHTEVLCPYCQDKFTERGLSRHINFAHGHLVQGEGPKPKAHPTNKPPATKRMVECKVCGVIVSSKQLEKHIREAHFGQKVGYLEPNTKSITNSEMVPCPHCPSMVSAKRLQKHIDKVHHSNSGLLKTGQRTPGKSQKSKTAAEIKRQYVTCPHCHKPFTARGINRHLKLTHNIPTWAKVSTRPSGKKSAPTSPTGMVKCPHCKVDVLPKNLARHIRKIHSGSENTQSVGKSPTRSNEAFNQAFNEPRDGSKYIGYLRREQGKFGSYPLHDDYGDESEA